MSVDHRCGSTDPSLRSGLTARPLGRARSSLLNHSATPRSRRQPPAWPRDARDERQRHPVAIHRNPVAIRRNPVTIKPNPATIVRNKDTTNRNSNAIDRIRWQSTEIRLPSTEIRTPSTRIRWRSTEIRSLTTEQQTLNHLRQRGLSFERADERYIAVDVPPHVDYATARSELTRLEEQGVLTYETCEMRVPSRFDLARRHAGRTWQPDGDRGRRYPPALRRTQGVALPHTLDRR
jgi:hypothetical protein